MSRPVYLDHVAGAPLRPSARRAATEALDAFGDPESVHAEGRRARAILDRARERVAERLGAGRDEIVFTSGGTEAVNLAVRGAALAGRGRGNRIVVTAVEGWDVLESARNLRQDGVEVTELGVDGGKRPGLGPVRQPRGRDAPAGGRGRPPGPRRGRPPPL